MSEQPGTVDWSEPNPSWLGTSGQLSAQTSYDGTVCSRAVRDQRLNAAWDSQEHNCHYAGENWVFGPPPMPRRRKAKVAYVLGYHPSTVGTVLGDYNGRFAKTDIPSQSIPIPVSGSHWGRDDQGNLLRVNISTGVIAQIISR